MTSLNIKATGIRTRPMGLVSGPSPLERVMLAFGNLAKQAAMANMFPLMDESIKECGNSILEMV